MTGVNLFGLEIELWRIGTSKIAPKFNVVCKPNDWVKVSAAPQGGPTDTKLLQLVNRPGFPGGSIR